MIDLLRKRRSIRKYTDQSLKGEDVKILEEALLRSPSSRNLKPWRFILVDDRKLLIQLAKSKREGAGFLRDAALGIVILGEEAKSDTWIEDCSIAAIFAQLTAQSRGWGSCWIQIRNRMHDDALTAESYIRELLLIPSSLRVEAIISLGYPAEEKPGIASKDLPHDRIGYNRFSSSGKD
ncbi:MAG: nitroreductase family protein [Candidatus Krumholzibacteriota bacterium]|nr:nitroreductase family protein [Candidatus Krumholzibacteriota bacterium]